MAKEKVATAKAPLNAVFSAPCHVAILRALYRASPASGRRIAREAGVNHQACADGLRRLERLGLVSREVLGRTHAFTLGVGHPVVDQLLVPLFREEDGLSEGRTTAALLEEDMAAPAPAA